MEINATLVIQILNFLIAWFILHVCYFKPAITYIYNMQQAYDQLNRTLADSQDRITQKEDALQSIWNLFKRFSKQHTPEVTEQVLEIPPTASTSELPIYAQEVDQLVASLQEKIIVEVSNVDL